MELYFSMEFITAVTAILGVILSTISLWQNFQLNQKQKEGSFSERLNHLLELAFQYPEFEYSSFIDKWDEMKLKSDTMYMRYDIYCNLLFNFLADLYGFYHGNKTKIENFCDVKTWVRLHQLNWLHPIDPNENIDGYTQEFRDYINSYLR